MYILLTSHEQESLHILWKSKFRWFQSHLNWQWHPVKVPLRVKENPPCPRLKSTIFQRTVLPGLYGWSTAVSQVSPCIAVSSRRSQRMWAPSITFITWLATHTTISLEWSHCFLAPKDSSSIPNFVARYLDLLCGSRVFIPTSRHVPKATNYETSTAYGCEYIENTSYRVAPQSLQSGFCNFKTSTTWDY